ncbi:MAG: 50S ribosomal protein L3 N(5)-glutamine methyltransferase [Cellvibrionaceae bacterium]
MNIQDCINEGEQLFVQHNLFFGHGTDNAADEALWLVFFQLGISWESDVSVLQKEVSEPDYKKIKTLFKRRVDERIPAAYLAGEAWFAGYPFIVNTDVLVPRSPIAELITNQFSPWLADQHLSSNSLKILDLCTGSGCIGITSALMLDTAEVTLSDISTKAIAVAEQNIEKHQLSGRVKAVVSDLFDGITNQQFDLIVSNPPYVDAGDLASMPAEFHAEPELGLASGHDGLDFTRRLLQEASDYLKDDGILICEVGNSWVHLESAFPDVPFVWLEFEQGGHGVFAITKKELLSYHSAFFK